MTDLDRQVAALKELLVECEGKLDRAYNEGIRDCITRLRRLAADDELTASLRAANEKAQQLDSALPRKDTAC